MRTYLTPPLRRVIGSAIEAARASGRDHIGQTAQAVQSVASLHLDLNLQQTAHLIELARLELGI